MCCHALLQAIFPTQALKPQCLPHWQAGWLPLAPRGKPRGGREQVLRESRTRVCVTARVSGSAPCVSGARTHGQIRTRAWVRLPPLSSACRAVSSRFSALVWLRSLPAVRGSLLTSLRSARRQRGGASPQPGFCLPGRTHYALLSRFSLPGPEELSKVLPLRGRPHLVEFHLQAHGECWGLSKGAGRGGGRAGGGRGSVEAPGGWSPQEPPLSASGRAGGGGPRAGARGRTGAPPRSPRCTGWRRAWVGG